jgi:hypothetical protein
MASAVGTATQYAVFSQYDPPGPAVRVLLGDGYAKWTNKGGWQYTARTRRISVSEYIGDDPYQMVVPCILDAWSVDQSIEPQLEMLRGMMTNLVGPRQEPAVIRCTGPGVPLGGTNWVIQTIEVISEIRHETGPRIRAELNVTLFQYVAPDILVTSAHKTSPTAAAQVRNGTTPAPRTYTVKSGDSLWVIAARLLGNGARWGEIATLNNIRDPRTLRVGTVLRIPA